MSTPWGRPAALALALLGAAQAGCLVHVSRVSDPAALFREAREEAARFERHSGPAREINVLAWDPRDRELVRVTVPLWLVRSVDRRVDLEREMDGEHRRWRGRIERHRHVLEDLERAGPGLLLEVLEDEGERVLVWLR